MPLPSRTEEGDSDPAASGGVAKHHLPLADRLPASGRSDGALPNGKGRLSLGAEGRDFWLHVTADSLEDSRGYQTVHGQLVSTQKAVRVYLDASLRDETGFPKPVRDLAAEIAMLLDQDVLTNVAQAIGPVSDVDQDGQLTVLITPWLSRLRGGETQVRGFVRSTDFRTDIASPFSNHADMLYLSSDLPAGAPLRTLLIHEVSHAALFSVDRPQGAERNRIDDHRQPVRKPREWDDWLNEGLAHLTERSSNCDWSNLDYRVARFWQDPSHAPLIVSDYYRSDRWRDHGCRGATYLFLDWCQREYTKSGGKDFLRALFATGQPGINAVVKVMDREFPNLYRDWTVSLLTSPPETKSPSRVGRFAASGLRSANWNLQRSTEQSWEVSGTATQFVELRSDQAGWYRLTVACAPDEPWQLTLLKPRSPCPKFGIEAIWQVSESVPAQLMFATTDPHSSDWQVDRVVCEAIGESRPQLWEWSAAELQRMGPSSQSQWTIPSLAALLPFEENRLNSATPILKVQWRHESGKTAWSWCDIPPQPRPRATQPDRLATLPDPANR